MSETHRVFAAAAFACIIAGTALEAQPAPAPVASAAGPRQLSLGQKPWKGDFDRMVERRMIRVVVPYSRTLYFIDKGRERGVTAELVRGFEKYVNRKYARKLGKRPLTVYLIPTTRDRLIPSLVEGHGDIAAGNLTATPERRKLVDFVAPTDRKPVAELVVTGPAGPEIASVEDLSGRTVHVREASSYYESLSALNERFVREGKAPVKLELVPAALEDEDLLEMLNAGLFQAIVVDDWKARAWAQILPKIKVHPEAAVRTEGHIGWAFRKNSPAMVAALEEFYKVVVKKQGVADQLLAQFTRRIKQISNNTGTAEWKRFQDTLELFRRYGQKYNFDPLMLAAQGFQESGLDQAARSHVGAIGIMQVMPETGNQLQVGDITVVEPNIHAGAKYMDRLMTKYFSDAHFSEGNRPLFAFASYNAGPGNIARMRKEAARRGLDPDKWFNNVEIVVAQKLGVETTTYVRNIYKYYVSYRLELSALEAREKALKQVTGGQ